MGRYYKTFTAILYPIACTIKLSPTLFYTVACIIKLFPALFNPIACTIKLFPAIFYSLACILKLSPPPFLFPCLYYKTFSYTFLSCCLYYKTFYGRNCYRIGGSTVVGHLPHCPRSRVCFPPILLAPGACTIKPLMSRNCNCIVIS